jgi:hypothetical protein
MHSETKSAPDCRIMALRCMNATSQAEATMILTLQTRTTASNMIVANVSAFSKEANLIAILRFHPTPQHS